MKHIFTKIFLGFLSVILIFTLTILYFSYQIIKESYQNNLKQNLININHTLEPELMPYLIDNNTHELDSLVKFLGNNLKARITLINLAGVVLADSKANPMNMENHADRPEIISALTNQEASSVRHSFTVNKDMLYVAIPIKSDGKLLGVSRISIYMDEFDSLINKLIFKILELLIYVAILILLFAALFSIRITKPINNLVLTAKLLASGDFKARATANTKDELKLLADVFNNMTEKLELYFNQTVQQKEELSNIIYSIQEGLVVTSTQGRIIQFNPGFTKATNGATPLVGKFIWEYLRENQIAKIIKKMESSTSAITTEIQIKDDYFLCSVNHINTNKELVFIFSNISELKKFENIKKEIVVNVSHELRTPLTVIKGYLETLEDDVDEKNRNYIKIIKNHTDRLINIVQDLLTISQLEEKNLKINYESIDLSKFFININETFINKLREKDLALKIELDNNINSIVADSFKLEQVFINLIDNAIKYSETGEITINVRNNDESIRFEITDTGIGIPEKDLERIFERFYTVDKSRSRQMAGTGLGLAIVKHIVLLHRGKITVESTTGKGSRFIIVLPSGNLN
ncbi:MAG: ATP-binding protein [Candidatus Kapabacteria bacterium]|nr:ATP-binding protein [Candidatus Kapabacteria bacterium]